jgi:hypothetical protein
MPNDLCAVNIGVHPQFERDSSVVLLSGRSVVTCKRHPRIFIQQTT